MPFISKDWRDPGKLWIKTEGGWEEKMVIERMEMSDQNLMLDDLLTAMQDALDVATQREAMAREVLRTDTDGEDTSATIHQIPDSEVYRRALFDDTLVELSRARQERRCIEWEISKKKCLMQDRIWDQSHESGEEVKPDAAQPQDLLDKDNEGPEQREDSRTPGVSQPSYLLLKINVRERVQYIEKNNTLLYISPCDEKDLKGDEKENVFFCETSSHSTESKNEDEDACATEGSKRTLSDQQQPKPLTETSEQQNKDERGKELQANEAYDKENNKPSGTQRLSRQETFVLPAPPHCHITLKNTREISGFNRLCEALKRLDFKGAAWDTQRFHYICKLIELLTAKKLRSLTGGSQKMLLVLLEEVARSVRSSQQNIHVLRRLVAQVQERLCHCLLWGKQLGSSPLWRENTNRLDYIKSIATAITVHAPGSPFYPTLQDLPEECVREILLRLTTHTDLQCAGESYSVMGNIIEEQTIWRQLCKFHWSEQQMSFVKQQFPYLQCVPTDWRMLYTRLKRSFGLREEFAVSLVLCRACQCLFWASLGHPCLAEQDPDLRNKIKSNSNSHSDMFVTIPPHTFLTFFS